MPPNLPDELVVRLLPLLRLPERLFVIIWLLILRLRGASILMYITKIVSRVCEPLLRNFVIRNLPARDSLTYKPVLWPWFNDAACFVNGSVLSRPKTPDAD